MLREFDAETRDGGFELRARLGLEGELGLHRARDAGGEQRLLVGLRQGPERGEGLAVVLDLQPVEGNARAVRQHRLARRPALELLVVHAHRRPVGGLADGDVEGVRLVTVGEHRAPHLEQHEVEGGLEVPGEIGLDERRPDMPQIVGEADTDAHLLARLGLAVLRQRHGRGYGRAGNVDTVRDGLRAVTVRGLRTGVAELRVLRHVLRLHQALDDLERAVMGDGDDAAGDGEILSPPHRPRLDGALDLVEAGLDGFRFRHRLLGPLVVVEFRKLGLAGFQLPDLGLLLRGPLGRLRLDAAVARGVAPRDLDHGRGPLPAGRQLVGGRLELPGGEPLQQHRVLEPDAALVVPGEQVAQHLAAGGLIGLDADEAGNGGRSRHALLGEQALHLPGGGPVALGGDLFPDRHLALPVGGDGEGLQHFEVYLVGPVGLHQFRRGIAEAQPLLDEALGHAEPRRDRGNREAGAGQLREGGDLVGRMHGDANDVLGERDFAGRDALGLDQAGHGMVGIEHAVVGQRLHGLQAAAAGDHGIAVVRLGAFGADDKVLQQPEGGDGGLELGVGLGIGRRLADILGGKGELAQRDLPDERFGPGGDEVHAILHGGLHRRGAGGALRPPHACPPHGSARPPGGAPGSCTPRWRCCAADPGRIRRRQG